MQDVPELHRRVYEIARTIQPGSTLTYGEIARRLGDARLAREVGQALARNPFPIVVPCHRVVASNGKLGGFSAPGGSKTKAAHAGDRGRRDAADVLLKASQPRASGGACGAPRGRWRAE